METYSDIGVMPPRRAGSTTVSYLQQTGHCHRRIIIKVLIV